MKKVFLITISFLFVLNFNGFSQEEFDKAASKFKSDRETMRKLKLLKKGGVERELDMQGVDQEMFVRAALFYEGVPYCMGGVGEYHKKYRKKCIDCSGLILAIFKDLGFEPFVHSAQELSRYGKIITDKDKLQKGDMIFFVNSYKSSDKNKVVTHSGYVINDTEFVHASSKGVNIAKLSNSWWAPKYLYGTRLFEKSSDYSDSKESHFDSGEDDDKDDNIKEEEKKKKKK